MNKNTTPTKKLIKVKKRTKSTPNKIDEYIENLYKYSAAHQMKCKMRQFITGHNSPTKKYFKGDLNKFQIIKEVDTKYGTICISTNQPVTASSISLINEALKNMGHDPEDLILEKSKDISPENTESNLIINTTAIKNDKDVLCKLNEFVERLDQLAKDCEIYNKDGSINDTIDSRTNIIKQIAARKKLATELMHDCKCYLTNYSLLRNKFIQLSTSGYFVRNYMYRDVYLGWDENLINIPHKAYVLKYLRNYDEYHHANEFEKFNLECRRICMELKIFTIRVTIDNYDYLRFEDGEEEY